MESTVNWIINGLVGLAGILGLFLAANAADQAFYAFGLLLFLFGVLFIFGNIKKAFDESETAASQSAELHVEPQVLADLRRNVAA